MDDAVLNRLGKYLGLKKKQMFHSEAPLDFSFFSEIRDLLRGKRELFYPKYTPRVPVDIHMDEKMIPQVQEKEPSVIFPV